MTRQKSVHVQTVYRHRRSNCRVPRQQHSNLFLSIFDLWLVESTDADPTDMEG